MFWDRNHLAKRYRDKRDELEIKRIEANNLNKEYETKLREKQVW